MPATAPPPPFRGLIPATVTPMHADGSIHPERIDALVEHYARDGADGLFVCGTTGESVSLSTDERMRLTERWCAAARGAREGGGGGGGGLPVGVNVTHTSLPDCKALAAHAAACGAAGFAVMAPFYFKPRGADELVAFCAEVAAAAPGLPFYYYHYPSMTGVTIPVADVLARAADRIPNLVGFKNSGENLIDVGNAMAVTGAGGRRFTPLYGSEAMMLGALALGVRDHIGGTYNFALPVYRRLLEAFDRNDLSAARAAQAAGRDLVNPLRRHDFQAATKAVMRLIGLDCGPARLPLRNLGEAETATLRAELERAGLFDERRRRRQTT
jgi:N-acetylneuraminate lyase